MDKAERLENLDNVKWVLTLLIVLYHIQYLYQGESWKMAFMFIKNLGDCVVPAFALISGFLFFSYVNSVNAIQVKVKRRILTLLVPYILWNIINTLFVYIMNVGIVGVINREPVEASLWRDIIMGDASPHFWYIFMLMFWCVFAPVLYVAFKDRRILAILILSQFVYIIYRGEDILHSRFIYILYTWGGYIGFCRPDLFERIKKWNIKTKMNVSILAGLLYLGISIFLMFYDTGIQFKVWLYAFKAVSLILATFNIPLLKLGKKTNYRYSFWIFAVHYWLDVFVSQRMSFMPVLIYQLLTWCIVIVIGLVSGIVLDKTLPKCFAILTGNR